MGKKKRNRKIAAAVMADETPIVVNLNLADSWLLLGTIQERLEKEGEPEHKAKLMAIAVRLETELKRRHPETTDIIADGWSFVRDEAEIREQIGRFLVSANDPNYR